MSGKDKSKLEVGLIPATAWGKNVRAVVSDENWFKLRQQFGAYYDSMKYFPNPSPPLICTCCDGEFVDSLHLHELWDFKDEEGIQSLTGFKPVCEACHNAIHFGRANKVGLGASAEKHLKKVNSWTDSQLFEHLDRAKAEWMRRSGIDYELDVSWLTNQGLLTPREIHMGWLKRPGRVYDRVGAISWARDILALPKSEVVILDTETTGLIEGFQRLPEAEVIELAVISVSGEELYNRHFKPLYPIPSRATKIHGITNSKVRRSKSFAAEFPKIVEMLHGKIIVSYNTRFDSKVIDNTCRLQNIPPLGDVTWECAMRVLKAYLEPATRFVKLPNASHTALADCYATLDLIHKMSKDEEILIEQA